LRSNVGPLTFLNIVENLILVKLSERQKMTNKNRKILTTSFFFFLAGLLEIGGGYLVWIWLRDDYLWLVGALGGFVLFLYGVVPTFQPSHFHRIYAAYGGVFIVMSLFWGWLFDGMTPDNYDIVGGTIALIGVAIIFYYPRKHETIWSE
jgi:small multidrug resistance family-3 protein